MLILFLISLIIIHQILLINTNSELGVKNIILRELEIEEATSIFVYKIKDQILKYYNQDIEIYMSLIDPQITNYINLQDNNMSNNNNTISTNNLYYQSHEKLFGTTNKFFLQDDLIKHPNYTKDDNSSFLPRSEILLDKIDITKNEYIVRILVMRNILFYSIPRECDFSKFNSAEFLMYYDLNLLINPMLCNNTNGIIPITNSTYQEYIYENN